MTGSKYILKQQKLQILWEYSRASIAKIQTTENECVNSNMQSLPT